jgi:3-methyladenine DNA glycosylase/8-oxoguanine DNA glycosylase
VSVSGPAAVDGLHRRYRPTAPLDLHATLSPHLRGRRDPCHHIDAAGVHWRTWRTPDGAATIRLAAEHAGGEIDVRAWGCGASWALDAVDGLLGAHDDWSELVLDHRVLRETRRRCHGLRLSKSGLVFEALVPAIIEQLVTELEARRTWTRLLSRFGEPAPGPIPVDLKVFPSATTLRQIADWEWHQIGLDGRRRQTLRAAAQVAHRLDECRSLDIETSTRRLASLPGIGEWTVAETLQRSHGAPDVISVGDYHLSNVVGYLFTGEPRTDDDGLVSLLEPYRPHRQRVVRLVWAAGIGAPRYGARRAVRDFRRM